MFNALSTNDLPRALQRLIEAHADQTAPSMLPRRTFIKMTAYGGGFALACRPTWAADGKDTAEIKPSQQPAAFVHIARDGIVTVTVNRLELGQGVLTALPMILAEELDAQWSMVQARHGNADPAYVDATWGIAATGGSSSVKHSFVQYRELGARTRAMLISAAAATWGVQPGTLRTDAGYVVAPDGRRLGYGDLAESAMAQPVPLEVKLKDPKDFRIIGRATPRIDSRSKSNGRQAYGIDLKMPGQLTAVIARPPVFGGRVASVDDSAAKVVKGVKAIVRVPLDRGAEGVAVIADGYWPARQAREALKVRWDTSGVEKVDTARQIDGYRDLAGKPGPRHYDADMAPLAGAPHRIDAEFVLPYLAHAPMEPENCTVQLGSAGAQLWVGSQFPGVDLGAAAKSLGLKPEQVQIHVQMAGGGFGRRAIPSSDYVVEACEIAKAAKRLGIDAPIRTLWSRENDIAGGYYRPLHLHRAQIGFDNNGRVLAWHHVIVGQSIMAGTFFEGFAIKNGVDFYTVEGMRDPYPLPMRLTVHHPKVNVPVLWWRSVGSTHTAFVMETLIDEIARTTKQDPVAYRMALFGDKHPRHRLALQLAVDKSGYGRKSLPAGRAFGVAVAESFNSVVAYVVEASVDKGRAVLNRVTAGVHTNLVVNPLSLEAQVQGACVMALSTCLPGSAITLKDGVVQQSNFSDFTVARMTDVPPIEVHSVPSADAPTGIGEPGVPPLAPAFANAIARLTGKALRDLPFKLA